MRAVAVKSRGSRRVFSPLLTTIIYFLYIHCPTALEREKVVVERDLGGKQCMGQ